MSKQTATPVLLPSTLMAMAKRVFFVFVVLTILTSVYSITRGDAQYASAATPATLNFQARLMTSSGNLVPDGNYNIEFKLYNAATSTGSSQGACTGDANCLWTETRTGGTQVQVKNGYMSAYLGDVTALPGNIWDQQLWLTMNIGGAGSPTWDGEMTPRIRMTSVPYAFQAKSAETLNKNTGSFTGTVDFATLTADRRYLFPDTSLATTASPGTICVFNGAASNCPAASGSAYYIQNDTVVQAQSNFHMQARDNGVNGTIGGVISGAAAGQTVDLLQFRASNDSTVLAAVTAAGNLEIASVLDTRTATTLNVGTATATAVSIGKTGATTTVNGALTVTQAFSANGGATITGVTNVNTTGTAVTTIGNSGAGITLNGAVTANEAATFNNSVTVAANQTLRLVGGTTANRPASPTEGMLYYDTDAKRLLIYSNGKWQADRSTASRIVGTSASGGTSTAVASSQPAAADYVNTSTSAAQTVINDALDDLTNGGTVYLMEGTYVIDGTINVPNNVKLVGSGNGTIIKLANGVSTNISMIANTDVSTGTNVTISDLVINGNAANVTGAQNGIGFANLGNVTGGRDGFRISSVSIRNLTAYGVITNATANSTITNSVISNAGTSSIYLLNSGTVAVSNNILRNSANGIALVGGSNNVVSSNLVQQNSSTGIYVAGAYNSISGNQIYDNGGASNNSGIYVTSGDYNTITGNTINDTSCGTGTSTCYGINIFDAASDGNYVADNSITDTDGDATAGINNAGTGTMFGGQSNGAGNYLIQPTGTIELLKNTNVTGNLTVTGLTTTNTLDVTSNADVGGNLTVDGTVTVSTLGTTNTDAVVCLNSSNQLAACNSTFLTAADIGDLDDAFLQGGNAFGASAILGTTDNNDLSFIANNITALTIDVTGNTTFMNDTTFNGSVTVAANQTLRLVGGTTANRPASPTAGMMYYDTDTKQLLIYANGKWQADSKTTTFIVAASNSSQSDKDGAQYVADGEDSSGSGIGTLDGDQVQINSALNAAETAGGGVVFLMAGTYTVDAAIAVPNNVTLAGTGTGSLVRLGNFGATSVNINAIASKDTSTGTNVNVRDLRVDGRSSINTNGTQAGIAFTGVGDRTAGRAGGRIESVVVDNFRTYGILLTNSAGNIVTNVSTNGSATGLQTAGTAFANTISGNSFNGGSYGVVLGAGGNLVSNNVIYGSAIAAIYTSTALNHITSNIIGNPGGATTMNAIFITGAGATDNTVTNNAMSDTSCTTSCYAIHIDAASVRNYLADNNLGTNALSGTVNNLAGANTNMAGQLSSSISGNYMIQPAGTIELMKNTNVTGNLSPTVNNTYDLGTSSLAWRTGYFGTSVLTPVIDTATAAALGIGTTNATNIAIGHNAGTFAVDGTNFDLSTAGVLTLAGGQTNDITTSANTNLTLQANGTGTISLNDTVTIAGTTTFSGVATDITTGTNEDLTVIANGTGIINLNDNVTVGGAITLSGAATDITTAANEDLTVVANGTGVINLNDTVSVAGSFTVTNAGNVAFQRNTTDYTAVGIQDNVTFGTGVLFRITSASAVTINGIAGGVDGRIITLANASANDVTLGNSASSTPANHIVTGTGSSLVVPAGSSVQLAYDSSSNVWRVIGGVATSGGGANRQLSNLTGTIAINASLTPNADNTLDLGSSGFSWRTLYADTSVLTPIVDTATATALGIGTTNATNITIGHNAGTLAIDQTNFDLSTAGVLTLAGGQTNDITTSANTNLTLQANGTGTISLNDTVTIAGTTTFSGVATDITTGTNEDLTVIANGTGIINLNDNVTVGGTVTLSGAAIDITTAANEDLTIVANGSGVINLNDTVSVAGSFTTSGTSNVAFQRNITDYVGGPIEADIDFGTGSLFRIASSTIVIGIAGGTDGRVITLMNVSGGGIIITNNDILIGAPQNRIITGTGSSLVLPDGGTIQLAYDSADSLWRVVGGTATQGGAADQQLSNLSGTVAINLDLVAGSDNALDLGSAATGWRSLYADTSVLTPLVGRATAGTLAIGTDVNSTAVTISRTGVTTSVAGALNVAQATQLNGGLTVSNGGNVAFQRNTTNITATGTQNDLALPGGGTGALFRITSASALTITSIAGGSDGRLVTLMNASANIVTLNNDAGGTAANRIITGTGGNVDIPAGSTVQLAYDSGSSRWRVIGSTAAAGGYIQLQSTVPGTAQTGNFNITGEGRASVFFGTEFYATNGFFAPLFDNEDSTPLNIGTLNASDILMGHIGTTTIRIGQNSGTLQLDGTNFDVSTSGVVSLAGGQIRDVTTADAATANGLTVKPGTSTGANITGATLTLQGGSAGSGNANGGAVNISGGTGIGTGTQGLVNLSTTAFTSSAVVNYGVAGVQTLSSAFINSYSTIPVNTTVTGVIVSVPDPAQNTIIGRVLYITARDGSQDFTLRLNASGTPIDIAMKKNSTATLIWNGDEWTAAGASSSTDLQSAYNNTLTSAGGAEIVLNPTGGAADGFTIRNNATTPINGGLLEVQSSIGTNLFSVNNYATEYATNGGAETQGASATTFPASTWAAAPLGGTVTRENAATSYIATGLGAVKVVTAATTGHGAKDTLSSALISTRVYQVSFTGKIQSGADFVPTVYYSDNGTADAVQCANTASLNSTTWSKITCTFTASGTITSSNAIIIRQPSAVAHTFYIDNLSVTEISTTTTPSNVQVGGGLLGGQPTLFTLDRFSSAPVSSGNSTYYGSMYFDTTTGRIQCYEADGWGACGSAPDNIISLTPEYTGAVLGTPGNVLGGGNVTAGIGVLTADFCANQSGILVTPATGNICASTEARNFYRWTSPQATQQVYSIYVNYKLPSTFKTFADANTIKLTALTDNLTNGIATLQVFRKTGSGVTSCGAATTINSSINTWQTTSFGGNEMACGFAGGDNIVFKIDVKSQSNGNIYIENLDFVFNNT